MKYALIKAIKKPNVNPAAIAKIVLENKIGKIIISIILGIGLASIFRKVCKDNNCIVIKGPDPEIIKDKIFKYDTKCYQYKPETTKCSKI